MDFDGYQEMVAKYDCSDAKKWQKKKALTDGAFMEKVLGLTGEAGETADKFKKIIRDKDGKMSPEDREAIEKELGDVLWYVAAIARYLEMPMSEVAVKNIAKLMSRQERNVLHGEGDNR